MKRTYILLSICILTLMLIVMILLTACTDDNYTDSRPPQKAGKQVELAFAFSPLQGSGATSRSTSRGMDITLGDAAAEANTRALTEQQEEKVDNICVLQFAGQPGGSTARLLAKTYLSDLIDRHAKVNLEPSDACFLYICANVGDVTGGFTVGSTTYQDILNANLSVKGQSDFTSLLPMSGTSGAVNTKTMAATDKIPVTLTRMVAKVSFTFDLSALPAGDTFSPINATLRNVPKAVKHVASATGTLNQGTEVDSYVGTDAAADADAKTTTYVWYMPENLRGTGAPITNWTERIEKNAPLYASYIELCGNYTSATDGKTYEVTYSLYLGNATDVDNYDVARNHLYTATVKLKGINLADQRVTTNTNLSADGLANCYLASKPGQWYHFNGTVRGNGNATDYAAAQYSGLSLMPSIVGSAANAVTIPASEVKDAVVVWETTKGMIEKVQWDASNGKVKFKTGTDATMMEGNALIAVRNSAKEILWSWHIWRTSFSLEEMTKNNIVNVTTNTDRDFYKAVTSNNIGSRNLIMMDRNLGASAPTYEGSIGACGLHYQFGRKDPFPSGVSEGSGVTEGGETELYGYPSDSPENLVSKYTVLSRVIKAENATTGSTAKANVDYTIKHPEKFIYADAEPYSWIHNAILNSDDLKIAGCLWGDNNLVQGSLNTDHSLDDNVWDGAKTIFDPCPNGWRVAPADTWTGIAKDVLTYPRWYSAFPNEVYQDGFNKGYTIHFMSATGEKVFCPASGSRVSNEGKLSGIGFFGFSWLSSSAGAGSVRVSRPGQSQTFISMAIEESYVTGVPVRCVKE